MWSPYSSVVEHSLRKRKVGSSILPGGSLLFSSFSIWTGSSLSTRRSCDIYSYFAHFYQCMHIALRFWIGIINFTLRICWYIRLLCLPMSEASQHEWALHKYQLHLVALIRPKYCLEVWIHIEQLWTAEVKRTRDSFSTAPSFIRSYIYMQYHIWTEVVPMRMTTI